ncbi:MAG: Hsp20/alpha crystallin family protein [Flavisolibacter sp.]|jgi:HSP20 family protein
MTLVRFNQKPVKSFNNLMDDFFTSMPSLFREDFKAFNGHSSVPVNVKETEDGYILEVVAPGLTKEDFKIDLENNLLTISAERKEEKENSTEKHVKREYSFASFKRSFTLDDSVDVAQIAAKYLNGVLTLNLPRKAEVKEAAKQISIQ